MRAMLPVLLLTSQACMGPWPGVAVQTVREPLREDTTWTSDVVWNLQGVIYIEGDTRLTIEPGTTILGDNGSALVVTRDAQLDARGTADTPIRFTSSQPEGERDRGDWGGVVLLGNAPVNVPDAIIEGVPDGETRGFYGGNDELDSCGILEYVEIHFAGFESFLDNELNGLTLGGCGRGTILRNIHVHMTLDDGIEFFGGTADIKNALITRAGDDGLDWDIGWRGRAQFIGIMMDGEDGDNGIEADNWEDDNDALPRSAPTIYNMTLVGGNNAEVAQRAIKLRRGTAAILRNLLVTGFTSELLDLDGDATIANLDEMAEDPLDVSHVVAWNIGDGGSAFFSPETGEDDDDGGFDEAAWFAETDRAARLGVDGLLPPEVYDLTAPDLVPQAAGPADDDPASPPQGEFWDEAADYLGAVRPGTTTPWYGGWVTFPED